MARYKRLGIFAVLIIFLLSSSGCEAFVRKFTRQKQHEEAIEPVLNPETQSGLFYDNETKYRNYFAYWRGWHDELIQAMSEPNNKRRQYCVGQALINLKQMSDLLETDKQKEINTYIERMQDIANEINTNIFVNENRIIQELSRIRLNINKRMHYSKVVDWIKK
jgi:ERCC4-related helicase